MKHAAETFQVAGLLVALAGALWIKGPAITVGEYAIGVAVVAAGGAAFALATVTVRARKSREKEDRGEA